MIGGMDIRKYIGRLCRKGRVWRTRSTFYWLKHAKQVGMAFAGETPKGVDKFQPEFAVRLLDNNQKETRNLFKFEPAKVNNVFFKAPKPACNLAKAA